MTTFRPLLALGAVFSLAVGGAWPGGLRVAHAQMPMQGPGGLIPGNPLPNGFPNDMDGGMAPMPNGMQNAMGPNPMGQDPTTAPVDPAATALIANIGAAELPTLKATLPRRYAISLTASLAELNQNSAARDALMEWVMGGGVVFLHTDAAQLFGYQTVPARQATKQLGGQLLGRARSALPFASQPLLVNARSGRTSDPARLPGVSVVFYSMRPGDQLVVSHPSGTPLLRVTDLPTTDTRTLYAAAVAPFGRGWAVVTPSIIDQQRGDGAAFARNLLSMVPGAFGGALAPAWVSIAQSAVNDPASLLREIDATLAPGASRQAPALPQFGNGVAPPTPADQPPVATVPGAATQAQIQAQLLPRGPVLVQPGDGAGDLPPGDVAPGDQNVNNVNTDPPPIPAAVAARGPVIMVSRAEALAMRAALIGPDGQPGPNVPAVLSLLQARIAVMQGNLNAAEQALAALPQDAAETLFIRGEIAASRVDDVAQASAGRAVAADVAAQSFVNAAWAQPLLPVQGLAVGETVPGPMTFGATQVQLQGWATEFKRMAGMFALEPPLTQVVGTGAAAITVRFVAGDPTAVLLIPSIQRLARAGGFGWRGDREEIILFPTPASYAAYREAAGLFEQNVPLPAAGGGDVIGQRIIMVSIPDNNRIDPNTGTPLGSPFVNGPFALVAHLHTYALLGGWFDGKGTIPAWFALGMETAADNLINDTTMARYARVLQTASQTNALLTPDQFEAMRIAPSTVAIGQATSLVDYFYQAAGPGAVTEWVQRIALGQDPDTALTAVAGGNQAALFTAWQKDNLGGNTRGGTGFGTGFGNGFNPANGPGVVPGGFVFNGPVPGGIVGGTVGGGVGNGVILPGVPGIVVPGAPGGGGGTILP